MVVTLDMEAVVELVQGVLFCADQLKSEYIQFRRADSQSLDLGVHTGSMVVEGTEVDVDMVEETRVLEGAEPGLGLVASAA